MELAILMLTVGSAVVEIKCGSIYRLEEAYTIFLNGEERGTTQKVVTSLFNLSPDRDYLLQLAGEDGSIRGEISFHTKTETAVLNVRDFGASGEGEQDDTVFIQGGDHGVSAGGQGGDSAGKIPCDQPVPEKQQQSGTGGGGRPYI